MRGKTSVFLTVSLVVSLCALVTLVQAQEKKAQLHAIWDVVVHPSKFMEYEAAAKEMLALYAKYECPFPWNVYRTDDYHYYFVMPVENFAALDDMFKYFGKLEKTAGEETKALVKLFAGTEEYTDFGMYYLRYDLSYSPEKPRVEAEDANFIVWNYYYLKPGMEQKAGEIAKEYQALFKSKNIPDGFNVWVSYLASDMPVFVAVLWGKSEADYYAHNEENIKLMGEKYQVLAKKSMDVCRKFEVRTGTWLRELSYTPKEK